MKPKVGLIGIIHEELKKDYWGTLKEVAKMGYEGLESAGDFGELGLTPDEYRRKLAGLGFSIPIMYTSPEDLDRDYAGQVALIKALGCSRAIFYWGPCKDRDSTLKDTARFDAYGARLKQDGIYLCYHNHEHEFLKIYDGKLAMELIVENSDPANLGIELDVGWVMMGKADPAAWLRRLKGRCPVIHLKDFYDLKVRESFTEVGTGLNDFKAILAAAVETGVEWGVVEQDKMRNLPPLESIRVSIDNLKKAGA